MAAQKDKKDTKKALQKTKKTSRIANERKSDKLIKTIKTKMKINCSFILFHLICFLIISLGFFGSIYEYLCLDYSEEFISSIGVLCQIITSIVSFVVSVLGIAISLQNENCLGISVKKFNLLRINCHYSIRGIIILPIILLILNILFYIFNMMIACVTISLVAVAFCIYISYVEIPIMSHNEQALIRIIKNNLLLNWKTNKDDCKTLKDVLGHLIIENNLQETYNLLKSNDTDYNKYLLLKLLDIQTTIAFDLEKIEDKQSRYETADRLIENIAGILYFHFDLTEILGDDIVNYKYYVTRVLFRTAQIEECRKRTTQLIATKACLLNYTNYNKIKKEFVTSTVISMLSISIASNDFNFVKAVKKEFSQYYHSLGENSPMTTIFALISLQMYYLSTSGRNVTNELKDNIKDFINESGIVDNSKVMSWNSLFYHYLQKFDLDFKEFHHYFFVNEHNWDTSVQDSSAYFVVLDNNYVLKWYLSNLFGSYHIGNYDYSNLLINDQDIQYYIKKIGDQIIGDGTEIKVPQDMVDFVKFYIPNFNRAEWFEDFEEHNHNFSNFIRQLHKNDVNKKTAIARTIDNSELAEKYRVELEDKIKKEWGYDPNIKTEDEQLKYLSCFSEKNSDAINYFEVMIEYFTQSIFHEIRRITPVFNIERNNNFDQQIDNVLKKNIVAMTQGGGYWLTHYIKNTDIQDKCKSIFQKVPIKSSNIFHGTTFFTGSGFSFNFQIEEFKVLSLTQEQINEKAEEYKRADGQYIYEGAFLSREEIENCIYEQFVILYMSAKCKVNCENNAVIHIDLYPTSTNEDLDDD